MRGSFGLGPTQRGLLWRGGGMGGTSCRGNSIGKGSEAGRSRRIPGAERRMGGGAEGGITGKDSLLPGRERG